MIRYFLGSFLLMTGVYLARDANGFWAGALVGLCLAGFCLLVFPPE